MGPDRHSDPAAWKITGVAGRIRRPGGIIDVGNSGTTLRLAMSSAALAGNRATEFTGDEQIGPPRWAAVGILNDAHAESIHGGPVRISGALKGGKTAIKS